MTLENPSRVFQLNLRPLQLDNATTTVLPEEADPYQLHGIHIELVDGTPFVEMHEAKDRITDRLCDDVAKSLDEVRRLVAQLAQDERQPQEHREVSETLQQNLLEAVTSLREFQGFINSDLINEPGASLPLDASVALRHAFEKTTAAGTREMDVRFLLPDVVSDVVANPQLIQQAFTALLEVMLYGASDNPVISVRAEEDINDIGFVMETADVSASVNELRRVFVDGQQTFVAELRQLREVRDWVDQWGGRIVVSTDDHRGIVIKLVLRRHFWRGDQNPLSPLGSGRTNEEDTQR
jgi:hypothetical protein